MLRCLIRIRDRKSHNDIDAWARLQDEGFIFVKGPSDDIETMITPAGLTALASIKGTATP
jgi:hypothetical protein